MPSSKSHKCSQVFKNKHVEFVLWAQHEGPLPVWRHLLFKGRPVQPLLLVSRIPEKQQIAGLYFHYLLQVMKVNINLIHTCAQNWHNEVCPTLASQAETTDWTPPNVSFSNTLTAYRQRETIALIVRVLQLFWKNYEHMATLIWLLIHQSIVCIWCVLEFYCSCSYCRTHYLL